MKQSRSMKKSLLLRRVNLLSKSYKQAWKPIIDGLTESLDRGIIGDADYLTVSSIVSDYTDIPTIRKGLMRLVNRAFDVGY